MERLAVSSKASRGRANGRDGAVIEQLDHDLAGNVEQYGRARDGEKVAWHNCPSSVFPHQSDGTEGVAFSLPHANTGTPHLYVVSGVPCWVLDMIGDEVKQILAESVIGDVAPGSPGARMRNRDTHFGACARDANATRSRQSKVRISSQIRMSASAIAEKSCGRQVRSSIKTTP